MISVSHSLYNMAEGLGSSRTSSSDDEEMHYLENSNKVLKRFKAYSERLKTSSGTSLEDDGQEERMLESRRSFLEIKELDMSEWRRNGIYIVFFLWVIYSFIVSRNSKSPTASRILK